MINNPKSLRILAYANILIQFCLPLASAFTPAIAGERHAPTKSELIFSATTQVYTLGKGETVASVADKYNITLDDLRRLNEFRVFSHGFEHLQPGDELDVPVASSTDAKQGAKLSLPTPPASGKDVADAQIQSMAGYASQAGSFLSNHPSSDAAASMAKGMVTGAASTEVQKWLSQFGTARIQLDVDKDFSLKNSQLDLLLPLHEQKDGLLFTQGSFHRTDDRNQVNLGVGYRWFADEWMVGGNTFLDYDISREHARMGVGVEYWRDFLKLGANGYQRLTGWKDSPDLEDYEERPANGWDIRAQGWLPALPQLGGKLVYEQYYGNAVGLFGKDNLQHSPHAITAEINYTPVPLLTLSASQRQGESGNNDTRIGMEMKYQFGVPWRQQLDPSAVAAMRTLAGSRYDLVDRNNNIILEYRKKDTIHLKTATLVTGQAGETKSLGVTVNSKYGVDKLDWSDGGLIAAGGKIIQSGSDQSVILPPWRSGASQVNTYMMSAVAVDKKGNTSNRSETQVTVQAPVVSALDSTFTPANSTLPADGKSTQELTLTIKDGQGNAVNVDPKDIKLDSGTLKSAGVSAPVPVRGQTGVFKVTVTAGSDSETVTVTPVVADTKLTPATVVIVAGTAVPQNSSISVDKATYTSGDDMKLTVTLKDAGNNPVSGQASALTAPGAVTVPHANLTGSWLDHGDGTYTATYVAGLAGTGLTATVKLAGWTNPKDAAATYDITASTTPAQS
ncbi:inverse autotransporter beta domain-containing protein, partial [Citrobacter freundii]|uniref:inverse autotransporter beta domain-containing protein n=1 Tax=Citrobacter freundii TaxID=546 RepID=UPI00300D5B47